MEPFATHAHLATMKQSAHQEVLHVMQIGRVQMDAPVDGQKRGSSVQNLVIAQEETAGEPVGAGLVAARGGSVITM